ncbi:MAG: AMP-dependent synthetase/ligase [Xanthobacteraceae bacterium]
MTADSPILVSGCDTPAKLFRVRAQTWSARPALRHKHKGIWHSVTWAEYYERARAVALVFEDAGISRGHVVTVLAENRPEWAYVDLGAQCMGMIGNGIYPTASPEQVEYILQNSHTRVLVVEGEEQLDKVLAVRARCPLLKLIVVIDLKGLRGFSDPQVVSFDDVMAQGLELAKIRSATFEALIDVGEQSDTGFLVYTSGTTGQPKGAMISNRNIMFQIALAPEFLGIVEGDKTMSFLPLCHIAERMGTIFNQLAIGQIVHFPENSGTVLNDIREVAPHLIFAPPRFWQKMYSQVELFMQDAIPLARSLYGYAFTEGKVIAEAKVEGYAVGALRRWRFEVLKLFVLSNVRHFLGLQNIKRAFAGAAPVPPDLLKWYMAIGVDLLEAYGMTETTGLTSFTPPDRIRLGYSGATVRGVEVRIGDGDEIQIRGPNVFAGYWQMPDKTAETLEGGWLRTGDCGALDEGYLRITDRMKDIIITSGGKNVTPTTIENLLKFSPYITDAIVVGDGRHYLTCLVMVDQDNVAKFAQDKQIPYTDFASLTRAAEVIGLIRMEVETANARLARVEQIKDFRIIEQLLTAEDEELTPTMKLKRKVVAKKYAPLIEGMYS